MRRKNSSSKNAIADSIARQRSTDDLSLLRVEVGDLATIDTILSITEHEDTGDTVLLGLGEVFDDAVVDGRALTIFVRDNVSFGSD
jgi:hypothetical protein